RVRLRLDRRARPGSRGSGGHRAHARGRAHRAGLRRATARRDLQVRRHRQPCLLDLRVQARIVLAVRALGQGPAGQRHRARAEGQARTRATDRTCPPPLARALRRPALGAPAAALTALIAVSTLLHWLTGRRVAGLWIMPDEAIYAVRALGFWHHGSLP